MGLALLELSAATGREDFRDGARRAFAYEDRRFDTARGNWPDLRVFDGEEEGAAEGNGRPPRFGTAWCHGAPGIALARLRALEIDPGGAAAYRPAAIAGLATTARAVEQALETSGVDATPCHGLTGLAEVLWIGGRVLGEPRYSALAVEATRQLLARHGTRGDWPSGAPSRGPNPSLMIGEAGVGYWLLRLHDSEYREQGEQGEDGERVPSVLLPGLW
jgi:lantibiotic modifying enzyme